MQLPEDSRRGVPKRKVENERLHQQVGLLAEMLHSTTLGAGRSCNSSDAKWSHTPPTSLHQAEAAGAICGAVVASTVPRPPGLQLPLDRNLRPRLASPPKESDVCDSIGSEVACGSPLTARGNDRAVKILQFRGKNQLVDDGFAEVGAAEPTVSVKQVFAEGALVCMRAEWRVDHVQAKLRATCGFPLVSPPLTVAGMPSLRLMLVPPKSCGLARQGASAGRQQALKRSGASETEGVAPSYGALRLKAAGAQINGVVTFNLTLGALRFGPLVCDFSDRALHGYDIPEDWAKHVEAEGDRLLIGAEILTESDKVTSPAARARRRCGCRRTLAT